MRPLDSLRSLAAWMMFVVAANGLVASANDEAAIVASPGRPSEPDEALRLGIDLERNRSWAAAIDIYEDAVKSWPDRSDLRQRLRLCEAHYKLGRRYLDASFRDVLLRLSPEKSLELYDELLERIEGHYVDPVAVEPLLRRGLDNLEVALRDTAFLASNARGAAPELIRSIRDELKGRRDRIGARSRTDARAFLIWAAGRARPAGISFSAVVLEFAFGACDALDDYTAYLTPAKLDDLFGLIDGNFVGLGVELKTDPVGLRLVNVLAGGPAAEAGLRPGDKVTHVGGVALAGLGLDEAAAKLQGDEGSTVALGIVARSGGFRSLTLVRRPVIVRSVVQARIVDPAEGVGYLQLAGFQKNSTDELRRAIAGLERQGLKTLVLDLRGNPGGLLNVAVDMADLFLDQGVIVSTRGRAASQSVVYPAHSGAAWRMPLIVLVDHDSASASEILAGALQENRRAVIVGERSYGKGSVQSIYPLRTAPAGLKLTTAKFYSPRNRAYSEQGVEPDVAVTARIAARPTGAEDEAPEVEFGDPARDPVLARALAEARRPYSSKR